MASIELKGLGIGPNIWYRLTTSTGGAGNVGKGILLVPPVVPAGKGILPLPPVVPRPLSWLVQPLPGSP